MAMAGAAQAQGSDVASRTLGISTSFDATLNYLHTSPEGGTAINDGVLELRPGFQLNSRSGRVRGTLSYILDAIQHTDSSRGSTLQNFLNANFTAEAVPSWAYVDASASISQQTLSAYGQQSAYNLDTNSNRSEVSTVSLSPYVRGSFGGLVNYEARLNGTLTNTRGSVAGDSHSTAESVFLQPTRSGYISWSLSGTRQRNGYRVGRTTTSDQVLASLIGRPDPEVTLVLRGGRESNDVLDINSRSYGNWGAQATWTPTPRTTVDLGTDHRYFGDSHRVNLEHRFSRSSFRFSSYRDISNPATNLVNSGNQTVTAYQFYDVQLRATYPDPVQRDQQVRAVLLQLGLSPDQIALIGSGVVNTSPTVANRQELGWTYAGLRTSFTVLAFSADSHVLDTTSSTAATGSYRQRGWSVTASHRLTPTASASLSGSDLRTLSTDTLQGNALRSVSLNLNEQVSRRINAALSARYTVQSGGVNPYHEQSISASVGVRF